MYFLTKDYNSLEKYNAISDKVSADIKKQFDSELIYNKEYLKTKLKSHGDEVTDFYNKEVPKVDSNHTRLAVISLDFVLKKGGESYYPQVFLKECKYIGKTFLGIFKIIRVIFLILLMSLIKNKLDLVRLVSQQNIGHYFSNQECTQIKHVAFLKVCLQCIKIH